MSKQSFELRRFPGKAISSGYLQVYLDREYPEQGNVTIETLNSVGEKRGSVTFRSDVIDELVAYLMELRGTKVERNQEGRKEVVLSDVDEVVFPSGIVARSILDGDSWATRLDGGDKALLVTTTSGNVMLVELGDE